MAAIVAENLTKSYGKHRGISELSLCVGEGDFYGFIGPNGAGKSTFYNLGTILPRDQKRINSDEILRENKGDWKNLRDQSNAMKEAVKRIKTYLQEGISLNQETTLTGNSIINNIRKAKNMGFTVRMYYVGLESADLAVARVADRVRVGGHGIEEKDIRKRYESSLQNLKTAIQLCDEVYVYDNTVSFQQVAIFKDGVKITDTEMCGWLEHALAE